MKRSLLLVTSGALAALLLSGAVVLAADRAGVGNLRNAAPVYVAETAALMDAPLAQPALELAATAQPIGPINVIGPVNQTARASGRQEGAGEKEHDDHAGRDGTRAREVRH
jgi:hypothetical protein